MGAEHVFFTVKQITRTGWAIRYTPRPVSAKEGALNFSMAFDVLVAGDSLANKQASLQVIADMLNAEENKQ